MNEISLDYIGGFFDGEGCVSIGKTNMRKDRRLKNGWELSPCIIITQKRMSILVSIHNTLNEYEIGSILSSSRNGNISRLKITGIKRVKKFCELVIPHTITKRAELELLLEYCNRRLSLPGRGEYTEKDLEYYTSLQSMKVILIEGINS